MFAVRIKILILKANRSVNRYQYLILNQPYKLQDVKEGTVVNPSSGWPVKMQSDLAVIHGWEGLGIQNERASIGIGQYFPLLRIPAMSENPIVRKISCVAKI